MKEGKKEKNLALLIVFGRTLLDSVTTITTTTLD